MDMILHVTLYSLKRKESKFPQKNYGKSSEKSRDVFV